MKNLVLVIAIIVALLAVSVSALVIPKQFRIIDKLEDEVIRPKSELAELKAGREP